MGLRSGFLSLLVVSSYSVLIGGIWGYLKSLYVRVLSRLFWSVLRRGARFSFFYGTGNQVGSGRVGVVPSRQRTRAISYRSQHVISRYKLLLRVRVSQLLFRLLFGYYASSFFRLYHHYFHVDRGRRAICVHKVVFVYCPEGGPFGGCHYLSKAYYYECRGITIARISCFLLFFYPFCTRSPTSPFSSGVPEHSFVRFGTSSGMCFLGLLCSRPSVL